MKKNDLDLFEGNDWLSRERAREKRVSAWDFDEGRKVRNEHEENCDVENVARTHHQEHLLEDGVNRNSIRQMNGSDTSSAVKWFLMDFVMLFVLIFLNANLGRLAFPPAAIVLFLGINPGIFIWIFLFKRFPSKIYCKILFIVAVFLQIAGMAMKYTMYYYH